MVSRFNNNPLVLNREGTPSTWVQSNNKEALANRNPVKNRTDSLRRRIAELSSATLNTSVSSSPNDLPARFLAIPVMRGGGSDDDKEKLKEIVRKNVERVIEDGGDTSVVAKTVDAFRGTKQALVTALNNKGKNLSKETNNKLYNS